MSLFSLLRFTALLKRFFGTLTMTLIGSLFFIGSSRNTTRNGYAIKASPWVNKRVMRLSPHKCSDLGNEYVLSMVLKNNPKSTENLRYFWDHTIFLGNNLFSGFLVAFFQVIFKGHSHR